MRQLICIISVLLFSFLPGLVVQATICPNQPVVTVLAADEESESMICEASEQALELLARYQLAPKRQVVVEVIEEEINHLGYISFGSYDIREDKIQLMSYRSILANYADPTMYGEQFDRIHYSGAIAHEITHAVFHHHSTADAPGPAPQEYLAHAIQLLSLPEQRRNRVLQAHDESAWLSGDAISDIYMALEPGKFAVKSYRHLVTAKNPRGFIEILLNAKWFYVYIP